MKIEEFKLTNAKTIVLEEKEGLIALFKIRSCQQKLKWMEKKKIPQKEIKEVVQLLLFSKQNRFLNPKTKNLISKIIYSPNERIIVLITKNGKEIIWNRDQLIKLYGWFFFVSETEKGFKEKKNTKTPQKLKKEEKIISTTEFQFDTIIITIKQKENMRGLYKTKEYFKYLNIINKKKIPQKPINDVLIDFFKVNENIPIKEKKSINKVIYYQTEKVIVIKSLIGDKMYENLNNLVEQYGWYFYITGVPVGKSDVSIAIDKIEKRFNSNYFKQLSLIEDETNPDKIRVALYAIALKPNHNCFILNIGKINILLDSGVSEEYFEHIKDYLNNFDNYLQIAEKEKVLSSPNQTEQESSNKIKDLEEFDDSIKKVELDSDLNNLKDLKDTITQKNDASSNITSIEKDIFKPKIDAIFISHSHYDHVSGLKELIKTYPDIPILSSRITMDLYILRDSDFVKQENLDSIQEVEYQNVIKNVIFVENGEKIEFKEKDSYLAFYHAGHMPGALMILVKVKDFRFLYTGDYTYYDIAPFAGTGRFLDQISRPIDFLLIDASSADENFGNISNQFHSLILFLEQKAEYGDNCLIGADPSSLAISFMLIFWRYFRKLQLKEGFQKRPNIYVDKMIRKNIQVINHRYEYIYGPISKLIREKANPFNSIKFRWFDIDDLEFLRNKNNIIISHPPDLSYGIIKNVINVIGRNPHNLVFLSGAIHEEPGLSLITPSSNVNGSEIKEIVFSDTWKVPFRALLINSFAPQIKIKLHGDQPQLFEMIKNLQPKRILFFHQSPRVLADIAKEVGASFDFVKRISVPYKRRIMILN